MNLLVVQIAGAIFLAVLALPLWRMSPRGGGAEWALGWCALYLAGVAFRFAEQSVFAAGLYAALGTLLPAMLYAGARRYAEHPLPAGVWGWIVGVAVLRGALHVLVPGLPTVIGGSACVTIGVVATIHELVRSRARRTPNPAERVLVAALPLLALTEIVHEWTQYSGGDVVTAFFFWLVSGCFLAGAQLATVLEQYRAALEARLVAQSEELRSSLVRLDEHKRLVAVGTLAAGMAHQINNPVGAIAMAAEFALLGRGDRNAAAIGEEALTTVLEEARRCGRIVKSVLQFARDEPAAKWVESLTPTVLRATRLTRDYVVSRGGRLDVKLSDDPLSVEMSPIDVEQAIINLIRNASESRSGGANVEVETVRVGSEACVFVADDGNGIDAELRARVLEPFFTTRVADGGSGLGLSVVHGIVTDHGGRLEIEGRPNGGTRICLRLPVVEADR